MAEYRRAIELESKAALGTRAWARRCSEGRFAEARTAVRRGLDAVLAEDPGRPALREKLKLCERMLAIDTRLPALVEAKERPAEAELLEVAHLCLDYGRPHAAARLYAAAFAARPDLADDLGSGHRYDAARAAARATKLGSDLAQARRARARRPAPAGAGLAAGGRGPWGQTAARREVAGLGAHVLADGGRPGWRPGPGGMAKLPDAERRSGGASGRTWRRRWPLTPWSKAGHRRPRDWARAADGYARGLTRGPRDEGHFWFEYAALLLLSGDRPGYA